MKKSLIAVVSMLLFAVATQAQSYNIHKTDGTVVTFPAEEVEYLDFADAPATNIPEGVEAVDLGLPSGLLWANMNVGATAPEDLGYYFSWGDTEPLDGDFEETDPWLYYKWCEGTNTTMTKYVTEPGYGEVDNKSQLEPEDDAAVANWGGNWRMPTKEDYLELLDNCEIQLDTLNGVSGTRFISKNNGNSVFFAPAGYRRLDDITGKGKIGYYWSATLYISEEDPEWRPYDNHSDAAVYFGFGSGTGITHKILRFYGLPVRPVCTK